MNNDTSAVDTKERLWALLNESSDKMVFLSNAQLVLSTIQLTQGLWVECNYCYKVIEFADVIDRQCREFLDGCSHAMTIKKIDGVRREAWAVRERFSALQQARMDPVWPDRIMSMSDMELAS